MLIEFLEDYYRQEADKRGASNPFRASAMGHCIRAGCFDLLGLRGKPILPRRMAVFKHGTMIHDCLTADLRKALGWRFVSESELGDNHVEIDGVKISYHIDGAFQHNAQQAPGPLAPDATIYQSIGILEIKTMSDYSFDRARKGEIDREYLCQAWVYQKGTSFNPVVFLAYRKETSAMVEIIFDRDTVEKIVTQRLGQDPVELAKQDPLLITEIRTPFDPSVEEYVKNRIWWLKETKKDHPAWPTKENWVRELVPGADTVEDEFESVQGKMAAELFAQNRGLVIQDGERSGSWYKFSTGRKVINFPCNYCPHLDRCFPNAKLEIKGDKPKWIVE